MEFLMDNWALMVCAFCACIYLAFGVYGFFTQPRKDQIEAVKAWLVWAVNRAEDELGGGGTGPMKLRMVYDMFCARFPWVARVVSFDTFSDWVVDSLKELEEYLTTKRKLDGENRE